MLHTKFQVPEKKIFKVFFTIYGHGGHFGHVNQMPQTYFRPLYPRKFNIKFGYDWPRGFLEDV